jgi:hypothetical protein
LSILADVKSGEEVVEMEVLCYRSPGCDGCRVFAKVDLQMRLKKLGHPRRPNRSPIGCLLLPPPSEHKVHSIRPVHIVVFYFICITPGGINMAQYHTVDLFGGAITASLPTTFADVR